MLILAIQTDVIVPCLSKAVMDEYQQVLTRPKFKFKPARIASVLEVFRDKGHMFESTATPFVSPDPTDTKSLQCAFAALADFLVTGNRRHYPASP